MHRITNILLNDQLLYGPEGSNQNIQNNRNVINLNIQFTNAVIQFLGLITQKGRKNQQFAGQYLALIVLDSIIYNIYKRNKNSDRQKINNSFYNSMSMSQMSDQFSQQVSVINNQQDLKLSLSYIQNLATSQNFFKKLKIFHDRSHHKNKNHHYLQNLLQTFSYILNKQKLTSSKLTFDQLKDKNFKTFIQSPNALFKTQNSLQAIQTINKIIFTNKLNQIVQILTNTKQQVYYALNRIYFSSRLNNNHHKKYFQNIKFNGLDMLYNLNLNYIESFSNKNDIFQQSKNPLFMFVKNYLMTFFLPTFKKFIQIILEASKNPFDSIIDFYRVNEKILEDQLHRFVEQLPNQLIQYLYLLHKMIDRHNTLKSSSFANDPPAQGTMSSITIIKRFFIYSFLLQPHLVKEFVFSTNSSSDTINQIIDQQRFEQICTYVVNLFFSSSIKKYKSNYSMPQLDILKKLSTLVQHKFEDKIVSFQQNSLYEVMNDDAMSTINAYIIQVPILNHDYQIIHNRITQIQFTPKDMKVFQMRKQSGVFGSTGNMLQNDILNQKINTDKLMRKDFETSSEQYISKQLGINSPTKVDEFRERQEVNSHYFNEFAKQKFSRTSYLNYDFNAGKQDQIDFLTWMTVGGTHNYKQKVSASRLKNNTFSNTMSYNFRQNTLTQQQKQNKLKNGQLSVGLKMTNKFSVPQQAQQQKQKQKLPQKPLKKPRKLKQFVTFNKQKVKQINRLYEQYNMKNMFYF